MVPLVRQLVESASLARILQPILGPRPRLVRSLLFDKVPGANWLVPWHQDLLHASSKASRPSHRRIIHLEFAGEALPDGLEWTDA